MAYYIFSVKGFEPSTLRDDHRDASRPISSSQRVMTVLEFLPNLACAYQLMESGGSNHLMILPAGDVVLEFSQT
jgi:hypothetical protein